MSMTRRECLKLAASGLIINSMDRVEIMPLFPSYEILEGTELVKALEDFNDKGIEWVKSIQAEDGHIPYHQENEEAGPLNVDSTSHFLNALRQYEGRISIKELYKNAKDFLHTAYEQGYAFKDPWLHEDAPQAAALFILGYGEPESEPVKRAVDLIKNDINSDFDMKNQYMQRNPLSTMIISARALHFSNDDSDEFKEIVNSIFKMQHDDGSFTHRILDKELPRDLIKYIRGGIYEIYNELFPVRTLETVGSFVKTFIQIGYSLNEPHVARSARFIRKNSFPNYEFFDIFPWMINPLTRYTNVALGYIQAELLVDNNLNTNTMSKHDLNILNKPFHTKHSSIYKDLFIVCETIPVYNILKEK